MKCASFPRQAPPLIRLFLIIFCAASAFFLLLLFVIRFKLKYNFVFFLRARFFQVIIVYRCKCTRHDLEAYKKKLLLMFAVFYCSFVAYTWTSNVHTKWVEKKTFFFFNNFILYPIHVLKHCMYTSTAVTVAVTIAVPPMMTTSMMIFRFVLFFNFLFVF